MNDLNHHIQPSKGDSEISLVDFMLFLKNDWKVIVIAALVGLALSIIYLAFTPKQFEADSQITIAQIATPNSSLSPIGINIEEPQFLIARMSMATSFTPQVIETCGFQNNAESAVALSKSIKLKIPKGVANMIELKTFGPSPQIAEQCNLAIFELIKTTQSQIAAPYIFNAKARLDDDVRRLGKARDLAVKIDKSGSSMGVAYFSIRDEATFLLGEISALENIISTSDNRSTRLAAPIFASAKPIAPIKRNVLACGLFGGIFLGLSIVMAKIMIAKLKGELDSRL